MKPDDDLYCSADYYEKWPEEMFYEVYSPEVQDIFKQAIKYLELAEVYTQRIDWFLSGDDGEESLLSRLKEDLDKL